MSEPEFALPDGPLWEGRDLLLDEDFTSCDTEAPSAVAAAAVFARRLWTSRFEQPLEEYRFAVRRVHYFETRPVEPWQSFKVQVFDTTGVATFSVFRL